MTLLDAQFSRGKARTLIARLHEIHPPNDTVRVIGTYTKPVEVDGTVSIALEPTAANQAYELVLVPLTSRVPARFVQVPDQDSINWEDLVDVNPSTFVPYGTGGGATPTPTPPSPVYLEGIQSLDDLLDHKVPTRGMVDVTELTGMGQLGIQLVATSYNTTYQEAPGVRAIQYNFSAQTLTGLVRYFRTAVVVEDGINTWNDSEWNRVPIEPMAGGQNGARLTRRYEPGHEPFLMWEIPSVEDLSDFPEPPETGTFTLQSVDGVLTWVSA